MKKEEKKLNLKEEEAKKEHTPEEQGCVKLTDEQMEQVSGGVSPYVEPVLVDESPVAHDVLKTTSNN